MTRRLTYVIRKEREASHPIGEIGRLFGFDITETADADLDLARTDVLWIQGNVNWYPRVRRSLAGALRQPLVVAWHTEPLPFPGAAGIRQPMPSVREVAKILLRDRRATDVYTNARRLKWLARSARDLVLVVSSAARQEYLAEQSLQSFYVPLGYHAPLGNDLSCERDIDVLFIGTPHSRRHRRAAAYLQRKGIDVVVRGAWDETGIWGDERTALINRAKIFLCLQRHEYEHSGHRMILGMSNAALVISEPVYRPQPFVAGKHFVSVSLEEMPEAIGRSLAGSRERLAIAREGRRFVTTELTMEKSLTRIFELIESRLAA